MADARPAHAALRDVRDAGAGGERRRRCTSTCCGATSGSSAPTSRSAIEDAVFLRGELAVARARPRPSSTASSARCTPPSSSASRRCCASASPAASRDARRGRTVASGLRGRSSRHPMAGVRDGRASGMSDPSAPARTAPTVRRVTVTGMVELVDRRWRQHGRGAARRAARRRGADPATLAVVEALAGAARRSWPTQFPGVAVADDRAAVRRPRCIAVKPPRRRRRPSPRRSPPGATRVLSIAAGVSIAAIAGGGRRRRRRRAGDAEHAGARRPGRGGDRRPGRRPTDDDLAWAEAILGAVGTVVRVAEQPPRRRHRAHRLGPGVPVPRRRGADRRRRRRRPARGRWPRR